jgi:ketosteroid isomerase-like protein
VIVAALQLLATVAACVALFRLLRAALPPQPWLQRVVIAGFLVRAVVGQALFWISWAHLPLLTPLQTGNGLWFYAADGAMYFQRATSAAAAGGAAVIYVQLLAVATRLFGAVTSTALLLNLFCYVAMIALLVRWSGTALAVAAIALSPSFILWSLQPLKDPFFQLLVVAFVCALAAWQGAWLESARWRARAGLAVLLAILLAALAGVRWYFALALVAVTLPFLLWIALRSVERKRFSLAAALLLALLLTRGVLAGGDASLPPPAVALLTPSTTAAALRHLPSVVWAEVAAARDDFALTGGSTVIQRPIGEARSPSPPIAVRPPASSDTAEIRLLLERFLDAWNRGDAAAILATFDDGDGIELWSEGKRTAAGRDAVREAFGEGVAAADGGDVAELTDIRIDIHPDGTATAAGRWHKRHGASQASGGVTFVLRRSAGGWRIVRQMASSGAATPAAGAPPAAPAIDIRAPLATAPPAQSAARIRIARLLTGAAALLLPRSLGERLGLFHIGGGRGLFRLTELDTILFDAALVIAVAIIAARFAAARRSPLVWLLVALALLIAAPMAYAVTNFGTLFRLREMILLAVILAPAAVTSPRAEGKLLAHA